MYFLKMKLGGNVDSAEGNDNNNNVDATNHETESSEPHHNIRHCSSLD